MHTEDYVDFFCPVRIISGKGALAGLPVELAFLNAGKPLILADDSADPGAVKHIADVFAASGSAFGVYEGIGPLFDMTELKALFDIYTRKGFDAILSTGGPFAANAAKVLNIAVSGDPAHVRDCRGADNIPFPLKPSVLVPTLGISWHEAAGRAFFENGQYVSAYLMPDLAVIDPVILRPAPQPTVIETALSALVNAVDAFISEKRNPRTDAYASAAAGLVKDNLFGLLSDGFSRKAATGIVNAAVISACACAHTGDGVIHHLGRAASRLCDFSEVVCMGVFMPYALSAHLDKTGTGPEKLLAAFETPDIYAATPARQRPDAGVHSLFSLMNTLFAATGGKTPRTLEDLGIAEDRIGNMVKEACDAAETPDVDTWMTVARHAFSGSPVKGRAS